MNLTSAAIEAAATAIELALQSDEGVRVIARDALEAAAPHMCIDRYSQRTEWPDIPRIQA